jgi:TetR/AcrR family transcriptional repressor of bet genes
MPKLGMPPIRRDQLIRATFETIDRVGLADATIVEIAGRAGLSTGIISHYFGGKDGLLNAAMRQILRELRDAVAQCETAAGKSPRARLQAIIDGNFDPTQVSATAMRVWLTFWAASMHYAQLRRLQHANDRRLYSNLSYHFQRALPRESARAAARGLAAMIDGLWLRGSLSGGKFDVAQAKQIAYEYLDHHLPKDAH